MMLLDNTALLSIPKLVIFDMDGLIFDTERLFFEYHVKNNKEHGYEITKQMYIDTIGLAGEKLHQKMFSYFGIDYPITKLSRKTRDDIHKHAKANGMPIKKGIIELLSFLKDNKIPCVVASSSPVKYVDEYLVLSNLRNYFNFIIGGDMITNSKPDPEIFLAAATKANISACDCLVLEDSENGIRAACAANMQSICIPDMKYPSNEIQAMATLVMTCANDVIDVLDYLLNKKTK